MNIPKDHTFKLRFNFGVEPGAFTAEDMKKTPTLDAADAVILFKLMFTKEGKREQEFYALDGRSNKSLEDSELWKTWALLSLYLVESPTLGVGEKAVCQQIVNILTKAQAAATAPKQTIKQMKKGKTHGKKRKTK
jgi:hypothetical protein